MNVPFTTRSTETDFAADAKHIGPFLHQCTTTRTSADSV